MLKPIFSSSFALSQYSVFSKTVSAGSLKDISLALSQKTKNEDAVKLSLSGKAGKASDSAEAQPKKNEGFIVQALKQVADITKRIADLKGNLDNSTLNEQQREATLKEIGSLSNQYSSVVNSDQYQQFLKIVDQVNQGIQSGVDPDKYYQSLKSQAGFLGDDLLGLIQHGSNYNLGILSNSLSTIGTADLSNVINDSAPLDIVSKAVSSALSALKGPQVSDAAVAEAPQQIKKTLPNEITGQTTSFVGSDGLALTLKSYSAQDLISAALNGVDLGPISVLTLTLNPKSDDKNNTLIADSNPDSAK